MIIDNHAHVLPDQAGAAGYPDVATHARILQSQLAYLMGRMVSSHLDPKYIPEPDEDVGFTVGKYGRWHWRKHGEDCWIQRSPVTMAEADHEAEQLLAHMDFAGVDMSVIQGGRVYMEPNYGREVVIRDCIARWPDRFIGTVSIDYDLSKDDRHLEGEIRKLTEAVEEWGFKALFDPVPRDQPIDDPRCEPLWAEVGRLDVPFYWVTGFNPREAYLDQLRRLEAVLRRHPEIVAIEPHVGANLRHPSDPEWVDNPREFDRLLSLPNFYLEMGYVLAYENREIWGPDSEYPYPRHRELIKYIYERHGAGGMVWGSDIPFTLRTCTYTQCVDLIRHHCEFMTPEDRALVLGKNLQRVYRL
jgi:predicted TIM-barrel fold metal-dependent hydrolase